MQLDPNRDTRPKSGGGLSRTLRVVITLCLAMAALLMARRAWTQAHQTQRTLEVVFACNGCGLDADEVRKAVLAESGAVAGTASQGAGVIRLTVNHRQLSARYQAPDRRTLERAVALPRDPSRAVQAIALLAANLVRDEAAALLEELRPKPGNSAPAASASAPVAPPSPAASASTAPPAPSASASVAPSAPTASASAVAPAHAASASIASPPPRAPAITASDEPPEPMQVRPFNFSVWHPVSLYPSSHQKAIHFELGLLWGRVGEVRGSALTLGVTEVRTSMDGASFATVGTASATARGGMVALGGNWTFGSMSGFQIAGIANAAGRGSAGLQLASANLALEGLDGVQLGLINYAGGTYRGTQIGLINIASNMSGTQIGALNIADEVKGFPVGPLNFNRTGRMQVLTWASTKILGNLGLRYLHRYVYTLLAAGWQPAESSLGGDGYKKVAWQVAVGGHVPYRTVFLDSDIGYVHEGAASQDSGIGHTQVLRLRAMAGWQPFKLIGLFAGAGLRREFPSEGDAKTGGEAIFGVQLF
ncbi:MAG: hypothetical protein HY898_35185 [Deltaproteobacteria bacterium]|nr:hypothetical protein [Deltaproteobacteria bacterium]